MAIKWPQAFDNKSNLPILKCKTEDLKLQAKYTPYSYQFNNNFDKI